MKHEQLEMLVLEGCITGSGRDRREFTHGDLART